VFFDILHVFNAFARQKDAVRLIIRQLADSSDHILSTIGHTFPLAAGAQNVLIIKQGYN
jgi:hypothetical protein